MTQQCHSQVYSKRNEAHGHKTLGLSGHSSTKHSSQKGKATQTAISGRTDDTWSIHTMECHSALHMLVCHPSHVNGGQTATAKADGGRSTVSFT